MGGRHESMLCRGGGAFWLGNSHQCVPKINLCTMKTVSEQIAQIIG